MRYPSIVINLDEIWLKGLNRKFYIKALRKNVKRSVKGIFQEEFQYKTEGAKHILTCKEGFGEEVLDVLTKISGIGSVCPARMIPADFDLIMPAVKEELEALGELPSTFRVTTKRSNKAFPYKSVEVSRKVGGFVKAQFGMTPKMVKPDLTITIRIIEDGIYVSSRKLMGMSGLPVGTSGHMVCMLSGGFDSPVASYLMSKRGVDQTFAFFYAYPFVGEDVKDKIVELVGELAKYQRFSPLFVIPYGPIQKIISENCKPDYRTLLFRMYMVICSNRLAEKIGAKALLTGDALSQVSSQTLENMAVLDKASDLPIFRPLIGFNKLEIVNLSKKVGTHDISVKPHDDACSLFAPKHPVIRGDQVYCRKFLQDFPLEPEIEQAIMGAEIYYFNKSNELNQVSVQDFFEPRKSSVAVESEI